MPEYGIDAIFALYCFIFQTGGYYPPLRHEWGTVTYRTNKNVDIYCTFVLKYKVKKCVERKPFENRLFDFYFADWFFGFFH